MVYSFHPKDDLALCCKVAITLISENAFREKGCCSSSRGIPYHLGQIEFLLKCSHSSLCYWPNMSFSAHVRHSYLIGSGVVTLNGRNCISPVRRYHFSIGNCHSLVARQTSRSILAIWCSRLRTIGRHFRRSNVSLFGQRKILFVSDYTACSHLRLHGDCMFSGNVE